MLGMKLGIFLLPQCVRDATEVVGMWGIIASATAL